MFDVIESQQWSKMVQNNFNWGDQVFILKFESVHIEYQDQGVTRLMIFSHKSSNLSSPSQI